MADTFKGENYLFHIPLKNANCLPQVMWDYSVDKNEYCPVFMEDNIH